jgi:uncharacterized membrane protein SpoIIM required for sporulation
VERRGLKSLKTSDIRQMASLYRSVSADLARAQTQTVGSILTRELQTLTSRAYSQIYRGAAQRPWRGGWEFYRWEFPSTLRRCWGYIATAASIFLVGGLIGWWFAWSDPNFLPLVIPERILSQVRDRQELWMGSILGVEPLASSQITVNNLAVAFTAVAGGITAGFYTVFILFNNGLHIGAIAALVAQHGLAFPFWGFVFPHGALELPAIAIAGGAGLLLGRAILLPQPLSRADALKTQAQQAAQLVYGLIPMLLVAGILEGFLSPNPQVPTLVKYAIGSGILALLACYWKRQR